MLLIWVQSLPLLSLHLRSAPLSLRNLGKNGCQSNLWKLKWSRLCELWISYRMEPNLQGAKSPNQTVYESCMAILIQLCKHHHSEEIWKLDSIRKTAPFSFHGNWRWAAGHSTASLCFSTWQGRSLIGLTFLNSDCLFKPINFRQHLNARACYNDKLGILNSPKNNTPKQTWRQHSQTKIRINPSDSWQRCQSTDSYTCLEASWLKQLLNSCQSFIMT